MATQPSRIILTYDDYARLPEDGHRYELFEGEIEMAPSPNTAHQLAVGNLFVVLVVHVRERGLGRVFVAPYDLVLSDITVLQPDIFFVAREHESIILPAHVRGAPDLVVEVISPFTRQRDREVKAQLYSKYGVPNYWTLDPDLHEASALALRRRRYVTIVTARGNDAFSAPPFPNLVIPLADIWE